MANEPQGAPRTPNLDKMSDAEVHTYFEQKLLDIESELAQGAGQEDSVAYAKLLLEQANALLGLNQKAEMWQPAQQALAVFIDNEAWEEAVTACDILYQSEQPAAVTALVHGVWLAIAFPIDPELSLTMLNHIIDEMPANADGAAVAAVTAHYIVSLRANETQYQNLNFATTGLIAYVAKRHSQVDSQDLMDFWMNKLQLKDPAIFLPRMGMVLNAIVKPDEWWFDRDKIREKLPD
ncbi:MAG: hypothetical protein OEW08_14695 [Gammaproteobacteria bacterium]|nr:hypothetical protein [Gammaproteobacteria bacterium]